MMPVLLLPQTRRDPGSNCRVGIGTLVTRNKNDLGWATHFFSDWVALHYY